MGSRSGMCVEDYLRILQNNERTIKNSVNLSYLLPKLWTKGLLTEDQYRLLQEMPYETQKNSQLVQFLQTKGGGDAMHLFIQALQEESEHLGHKTLAVTLLQEISAIKSSRPLPPPVAKKPAPPTPRKSKVSNTITAPFITPQPVRKQPLFPLHKKKSQSVGTGLDEEPSSWENFSQKYVLDQEPVHTDPEQHHSIVYISTQLKQINGKLDAYQNAMQMVQQLSRVVVDMKEKMETMEQLLHSLLENQQCDEEERDYSQNDEVFRAVVDNDSQKSYHDYLENPVSRHSTINSPTNENGEVQHYDYVQIGRTSVTKSEYTSLIKKPEVLYENSRSRQKFNQVHYEESQLLASGHSGEYWLAVSRVDRSKIVVKKPAAAITAEMLGEEVNALLKCKHPNIIQFIMADMNTTEQIFSLYFEYAEKGQLQSYLQNQQTNISLGKLLAMASNIASGMEELERHKVVHCDLKTSNILLDGDYLCKIASFNKAQCLKENEKHRVCDLFHLSTRWLAPEVLNSRKFSIKSDVWSFGVVLAELFLYGSKPYPNMKGDEVKKFVIGKKKMHQPIGCPKEVYCIMKECFHYREDQRFPFTAVKKALKELQSKFLKKKSDESFCSSEYED